MEKVTRVFAQFRYQFEFFSVSFLQYRTSKRDTTNTPDTDGGSMFLFSKRGCCVGGGPHLTSTYPSVFIILEQVTFRLLYTLNTL